jgi:ABC-type multidrug transport system fused ATPase/permease subunit
MPSWRANWYPAKAASILSACDPMTASSEPRTTVLPELLSALRLLTASERKKAIAFALFAVVSGLFDTIALASTMPFIALLVDVDSALKNERIAAFHALLGRPDPSTLVIIAGSVCLALVICSGSLSAWIQRRTNRFVARCQARLAKEIMDALVHAPYVWFLGINTQVVSHVFQRDVLLWARELVYKLLNMARDVTLVVMPLVLVLIVTPVVGVLTLGAIAALVGAVIRFTHPRITMLTRTKQDADARAFAMSGQALTGIKDVSISGRQREFVAAFARAYNTYTWANAEMQNQHQLPNRAILLFGQVGLLAVAIVLWALGSDRGTLAAQLSLLILVTSRIVPAANRLSSAITTFFAVLPSVRGIESMLMSIRDSGKRRPELRAANQINRPWKRLSAEHVGFTYPNGNVAALDDISLAIEAGKTYGIVGASGSGKSSVADLLMGFIAPQRGWIKVDDCLIDETSVASWQAHIGYVPQVPFILDDTLAANVAFGVPEGKRDAERVMRALTVAHLSDLLAELPAGLGTNLGDRGLRVSGGQRQRIAIARALYDECDLLVLDEATSALDSTSERAVQDALAQLKGKIATVTIAHRLSTIHQCDRIFLLDQGRLVAEGSWNELLANSPLFQKMVEMGGNTDLAA